MSEVGAVIDVSNVCWSDEIAPLGERRPRLGRLDLLRDAWRRGRGASAELTLIADESLRRQIPPAERRRLDAMVRAGEIRLAPTADPELLTLARDSGLYVISRDQFVDLRRAHPWIPSAASRFLAWRQGPDGLRFVRSGVREVPEQRKSRAEEQKELIRGSGVDLRRADHARVMEQDWRCVSAACFQAMLWPDRLLLWPDIARRDGSALCPTCGSPLEAKGPRPPVRVVVVSEASTDEEILRFPLATETSVLVGRGSLPHGVNLAAPDLPHPAATGRVSRRHVMLSLSGVHGPGRGGRLAVTELGSSNGTVREPSGAGGRTEALVPGEETVLGPDDALVLAGSVRLRLSGRLHFPGERGLPSSPGSVAATTELAD
ncbi:FHA domain-containing protein [Streptomyces muensis]|uniref:FHA domain-containing protein n=1 Tax=Streptomyces muensis TaxID=1077944 RepID=A0A9X1PXH5_STRM4|nr:FHA domain-containing protein [Streptomyces muensis]MCF1594320.1 FHA domain-containing protein [Streptomyces muensis]